jgi:hypothetical protein
MKKGLWASMGVVDTSTSQERNFCIRSQFGVLVTLLERYSQGVHIIFILVFSFGYMIGDYDPKKHRLGPQNDLESLGPEKL